MIEIGKAAPQWQGVAYSNGEQATISSDDYKGKWYVMYWYPLDFTFVCPTEIQGFQALLEDFEDDSIAVIGASTDSFYSHKAWLEDEATFPNKVTHPILADTSHEISSAFGVLKKDDGIAFRATIVVDPDGIARSVATNDLSVGRSPSEVLRTVQALISGGLCGANWSKGEDFVGV